VPDQPFIGLIKRQDPPPGYIGDIAGKNKKGNFPSKKIYAYGETADIIGKSHDPSTQGPGLHRKPGSFLFGPGHEKEAQKDEGKGKIAPPLL